MSTSPPSILSRIHNTLALHTEHSVCVYVSADGANFEAYPSPLFGSSITEFSSVLPDLNTRIVIQASNVFIQQAVALTPYFVDEIDFDTGCSVRIVSDVQGLIRSSPHYERAAFIRADKSLVVWGDDEETTLGSWNEIICRVQSQSEIVIPFAPVAGLPVDTPNDPGDFDASLPYLNELAFLPAFPEFEFFPFQVLDNFVHPSLDERSLALALQGAPSPFSDTTSASMLDSPFTADLESMPPSYPPLVYVSEEEEPGPNLSLDFSTTGSARVDALQGLAIDQEAKPKNEEAICIPQPIIRVNGGDATTAGNADGDRGSSASEDRMRKRSRSDFETPPPTPALLTVSLPRIGKEEPGDEYVSCKFLAIAPAPPPASPTDSSASSSASTSTLTPAPIMPVRAPAPASPAPSSASAFASASASGRKPRRTNNRRRAGGGAAASRAKRRYQCEYCPKTFSRQQDQERHSTTSCDASPHRSTVNCPECGAILSRRDAAQRHWRGHENPSCAPPEWVSGRW